MTFRTVNSFSYLFDSEQSHPVSHEQTFMQIGLYYRIVTFTAIKSGGSRDAEILETDSNKHVNKSQVNKEDLTSQRNYINHNGNSTLKCHRQRILLIRRY